MKTRLARRNQSRPISQRELTMLRRGELTLKNGKGVYSRVFKSFEEYKSAEFGIDLFLVNEGFLITKKEVLTSKLLIEKTPNPFDGDEIEVVQKQFVVLVINIERYKSKRNNGKK